MVFWYLCGFGNILLSCRFFSCMKRSRFFFRDLRIVLILHRFSQDRSGSIVVERSNATGVWNRVDRIGHYTFGQSYRTLCFDSKRLGHWLNKGALVNSSVLNLLADFSRTQGKGNVTFPRKHS